MAKIPVKDADYEALGLTPPEHIPHPGSEEVKLDTHIHKWIQDGPYLHCNNGQHGHGIPFDHVNKILVGTTPEGAPILEDLTIVEGLLDDVGNVSPDD